MSIDLFKGHQGIKLFKLKADKTNIKKLEDVLSQCPGTVRTVRRLHELCGHTEHLSENALHFTLALLSGLKELDTECRDIVKNTTSFNNGVTLGLTEAQSLVLSSKEGVDVWDCLVETSREFYERQNEKIKVVELTITIEEEAKDRLAAMIAGHIMTRTDLQLLGIPSIGRSRLISEMRDW